MSKLLWIAVPGGFRGIGASRQALLRVLVAPRLDGPTLQSNGMADWPPASLVAAPLTVEFATSPDSPVQRLQASPPHIQAVAGAWAAFFGSDTVIQPPRTSSATDPQVNVSATSTTAAAIVATFTAAAATPLRLGNDVDRAALDNVVRAQLAAHWSADVSPSPPPALSLAPKIFQPPEFHHTVALLREHPAVLRALGLIVELSIPAADMPIPSGVVRIGWPEAPTLAPTLPEIESPWTQFDNLMLPASTQNISAGMVALSDDRPGAGPSPWQIVSVDVDSAEQRLRSAARASAQDATEFPLPTLRSAGLMLVRSSRQADFDARREIALANAGPGLVAAPPLTADDLVLGYRIDVKSQGRDWASLHARLATYSVARSGAPIALGDGAPALEEGQSKAFSAIDDGSGALRTDEVVARWSGWSLAAPLPTSSAAETPCPGMPFAFRWTLQVPPGTLPRLRFGHSYTMRARVADLAGGGLDASDPAADRCFIDPPVIYRRYEPLASPPLSLPQSLAATALGPGESIAQVAMHEEDETATSDSPALTRMIVAPSGSLTLAEQHGFLDTLTPSQVVDLVRQRIESAQKGALPSGDDVLFPDVAAEGVCVYPQQAPGAPTVAQNDRAWTEPWPAYKPKAIVLRNRVEGESVLAWETPVNDPTIADRLVVRLARAEELTLELSSTVKDEFLSHLAVTADVFPDVSQESASAGRHPMVTPVQAVTFTHAVRSPINSPAGTFTASRGEGDTFAVLTPTLPCIGADLNSTAKLEIDATWTEPAGDGGESSTVTAVVQTVAVSRGDPALAEIRHEFGDTRHRMVTYTATAVSRFRQFYAATEDDSNFLAASTLGAPVVIPSSARPPPPIVLSTRPAFKWEESVDLMPAFKLVRKRLGGTLRLEIDGPWYLTGEGEQLAVILASDPNPPAELWPLLTQVGADPIREPLNTGPNRFPTAESFADAASAPLALVDADSGMNVVALPYTPWASNGRWFVDVAIPVVAAGTFWPFSQLAVARFQGASNRGLELSQIVRTEMVQLMPERTLTIRRTGSDVFVSLDGPVSGPGQSFPSFEVFLDQLPTGVPAGTTDLMAISPVSDGTPAWIAGVEPQGGSLGPQEFHFVIGPNTGPVRVRVAETFNIDKTPSSSNGPLSARVEFSDAVLLPAP